MGMGDVIGLDLHERMTPKEATGAAARQEWEKVMVLGWQDGRLVVVPSAMTREEALFLLEHAKLYVLEVK